MQKKNEGMGDILSHKKEGKLQENILDSSLPNNTPSIITTSNNAAPATRISIVTPSFNQAHFLEECIDSVLSQGYANLE